ncbi:hypothetical protein [Kitasatospora putterlickiae]
MIAAEALAAGLDTLTLCELAGLPRTADTHDFRDAFERARSESGIALPDPVLARRPALRRLAARLVDREIDAADLATDELGGDGGRNRGGAVIRAADPAMRVLP